MSLVPKAEFNPSPEPHDQLVNPVSSLWHNPMVVQLPGILPSSSLSTTDPASTGSASTSDGNGMPQDSPGSSHSNDLSGDAEGVWAPDIDQAFHEALQIYPPCGRRKIILSDEGKMYGRNELIARYIKIRCGKTRTRKQVSSHIQVLARKKHREMQTKMKGHNPDQKQPLDESSPQQAQKSTPISLATAPSLYNNNSTSSQAPLSTPNGAPRNILEHPKPLKIETGNLPDSVASVLGQAAVAAIGQATAGMPQAAAAMAPTWPYNPHTLQSMFPPYYTSLNPEESLFQMFNMANIVSSAAQMPLLNGKSQQAPPTEDRTIASSKLTLCGFVAYVQGPGEETKTDLLRIPRISEEPMENIQIGMVLEKYPPELVELFNKGPTDAFFLVKCWANVAFSIPNDERTANYAVDSYYETPFNFDISVSTKVCSFGKQVVEKVEIYSPIEESSATPLYHFKVENSPMCDYMVRFIAELKKLGDTEGALVMNNVLDNFTILQIVKNKETDETLMVIAFVIEVSPEPESSCRIYRLVH